ncbi:MAG TPA: phosphate signaling complex protein PhoU [Desulfobacteraceae bacterium]|nr:phosphate signaling complex protein PhoU [Desulfobacteraceae bacterium]HPJ66614.1 phosphate signaling complex protein PhoU [Desulfobacteraceae bacterium]HPQ27880.1 phosphate signaling complex protein PhoU [Desulfobacteraceae bacterium]
MEQKAHTSRDYEKALQNIREDILYAGAFVEKAIQDAMTSLLERDSQLARKVIDSDEQLNQLDKEIEKKCLDVIALRQPVAKDLRFITTAIKINGHLERIGDMAANIAEKVLLLNEKPQLKPYIDLPRMSDTAQQMIKNSLDALVREDYDLAEEVIKSDEIVDNLNDQIFRELLTFMMEDPPTIHRALLIMQIAKNLERISDHATSIAVMIIYLITGRNVRHRSKTEKT